MVALNRSQQLNNADPAARRRDEPVADPAAPVGGEGQPRLTFLQQPWAQNVLPILTSLCVHSVILVLAVAAAKVIVERVSKPPMVEQTFVPDSQMVVGPAGGVPHTGPDENPFKQVIQTSTPDGAKSDGWASRPSPNLNARSAGAVGDAGDAEASPLAVGPDGVMGSRNGKSGAGSGGEGGPLATFGFPSSGGGIGPHSVIFGRGNGARQIVYLCDASGSMLNKMGTLKQELQKAVDALMPVQSFNIIFFQENHCLAFETAGLVPATPDYKRKAFAFLDNVTAVGTTDPNPGLALAFGQHPELLYLLTDGDFPDNAAVKTKIAELNREHRTKINTIAFVDNADTDTQFLELLDNVAKDNGGNFKHVAETDVNQ